ncbi:hypothetical protein MF271_11535 [Deinococcus sp. KNUC1210]|uniref:hypothetical protein n=1 Tax=Deinococcus sp. KNUC1210 TaxID=2917691 RepID=UPI001EF05EDD|nr:hypothetical protein [Deinococcus sp. KNUC1210]ULH14639.1 hypothetical protein MF271_11535 [Deinococcus sp. KNUC1210]
MTRPALTPDFLRRRNALWQQLRAQQPQEGEAGSPEFERLLADLSALIGWDRARILAGLGLHEHH